MKKMLLGITMVIMLTSAATVTAEETNSSCIFGDIAIIDSGNDSGNCISISLKQILLLQKVATTLNYRGLSTLIKKVYVSSEVIKDTVEFDDNRKMAIVTVYTVTLKTSYGSGYIAIGEGESSSSQAEAFAYALVDLIVDSQYK